VIGSASRSYRSASTPDPSLGRDHRSVSRAITCSQSSPDHNPRASAKYTITCADSLESRRLGCLPCAATTSPTASLDSSEASTPNGRNSCNEPDGISSTFMVTAEPYAHTDSEFSQKIDRRS